MAAQGEPGEGLSSQLTLVAAGRPQVQPAVAGDLTSLPHGPPHGAARSAEATPLRAREKRGTTGQRSGDLESSYGRDVPSLLLMPVISS